jgi:hypothetical protein
MNDFALITNRKRAVIALAHSVVFLLIALRGFSATPITSPIWMRNSVSAASILMLCVFLIVTAILLPLVRISRCAQEKMYFSFCSVSASLGFIRLVFGDPQSAGLFLRVLMLICAVATGTAILRGHSRTSPAAECEL